MRMLCRCMLALVVISLVGSLLHCRKFEIGDFGYNIVLVMIGNCSLHSKSHGSSVICFHAQ